ncbi:hypothetical protein QQF64_031688, partial [Cirrhinus molitorella]
ERIGVEYLYSQTNKVFEEDFAVDVDTPDGIQDEDLNSALESDEGFEDVDLDGDSLEIMSSASIHKIHSGRGHTTSWSVIRYSKVFPARAHERRATPSDPAVSLKAVDLLSGPMPAVLWKQSAWLYAEFTLLLLPTPLLPLLHLPLPLRSEGQRGRRSSQITRLLHQFLLQLMMDYSGQFRREASGELTLMPLPEAVVLATAYRKNPTLGCSWPAARVKEEAIACVAAAGASSGGIESKPNLRFEAGQLVLRPSKQAATVEKVHLSQVSKGMPFVPMDPEVVLGEAKLRIIRGEGDPSDDLLLASESAIQFGQYRGKTFK